MQKGAIAIGIVLVLCSSGCAQQGEESTGSSESAATASTTESQPENNPAKNASESNIPRVGPTRSVEVDDLRWKLTSCGSGSVCASAMTSLGNEPPMLFASGGAVFVVVDLEVTSHRSESATLTDEVANLVVGKKTYSVDSDAELHLPNSEKTLAALELGPSITEHPETVFQVPLAALAEHPELRFNELGLGSTHGYIALPALHVE